MPSCVGISVTMNSKLKGTQVVSMPQVLKSVYNIFESTCNGAIGQTIADFLPAHTETEGEVRKSIGLQ